jgi:predicted Zn-dependent protease
MEPVARMANTILESKKACSFTRLKKTLLKSLRKKKKKYGLIIHDITGGFTHTERYLPQSYKLQILSATKVYTDGRPDEIVRGIDMVGTPLATLKQITVVGNDVKVFYGYCGAESGWIPVSSVSPSLLIGNMEFESQLKDQNTPPILPPPEISKMAPDKSALKENTQKEKGGLQQNMLKPFPHKSILLAMNNELQRSMQNLKSKENPGSYFTSYLLWDIITCETEASLGSLEKNRCYRENFLDVDLRVGDYQLDNTNFGGAYVGGPSLNHALPQFGDTNLIKLALWSTSDRLYKVAVETYAQKKAFLQTQQDYDSLPDFTRQQARKNFGRDLIIYPDTGYINSQLKNWSGRLRAYPWLAESRLGYLYYYSTLYYVDSEGASYVQGYQEHTLLASILAQTGDGSPVWEYLRHSYRDSIPKNVFDKTPEELLDLVKRLEILKNQPAEKTYRGPLILKGPAAGGLIQSALLSPQEHLRTPLGSGRDRHFLLELKNKKYFPSHITIVDSPSKKLLGNRKLHGYYPFDHQGQPAGQIKLIENGRLINFYTGKTPIQKDSVYTSNGHWRYNLAYPGVVEVSSTNTVSDQELSQRLRKLSLEEGNDHGLTVSKFADQDALGLLRHPLAYNISAHYSADQSGTIFLPTPVTVDKIDGTSGELSPTRGLAFNPLDSKSLRMISGTGQTVFLLEPQASFTVLCPALLMDLVDLKEMKITNPRLPYLTVESGK